MKILITGSRYYKNDEKIFEILSEYDPHSTTLIHGGAKGADFLAGFIGQELGFKIIEVPAKWDKFGKAAGILRNQEMLNLDPDLVIGFHEDIEKSRGTKDMIARSKKKGVPTLLYK